MISFEEITFQYRDLDKFEALNNEAFPECERLPVKFFATAREKGFFAYGIYDDETFIGYISYRLYKGMFYLMFYAICKEYRSKGYGSRVIEELFKQYKDYSFIVEMEEADPSTDNYQQRLQRHRFYERLGFLDTHRTVYYYDTNYEIYYKGDPHCIDAFIELFHSFPGFHPVFDGE